MSSACSSSTDMLLRSSVGTRASDEYCMVGKPLDKPVLIADPSGTVARLGCAETELVDMVLHNSNSCITFESFGSLHCSCTCLPARIDSTTGSDLY